MTLPILRLGATKFSEGGEIQISQYPSGNIALFTINRHMERELVITTNLEPNETADEGCVFIKNYSENEGCLQAMLDAGHVELTGREVQSEFVTFPEVKLLFDPADYVRKS